MSYYSVIRYTPNPLSEESINFGLLVFDGEVALLRVTEDWHRAKVFGRKAPTSLQEAIQYLVKLDEQNGLTEKVVRKMADAWQREVTLTPPRASTLEPEDLIERLTPQMLRFPETMGQTAGKRRVLRVARDGVLGELVRRYKVSRNRARGAVRSGTEVDGRLKEHTIDLAVYNGVFLGGAIGVSLAHGSKAQTDRELDGVAFAIEDLKNQPGFKKRPLYVLGDIQGLDQNRLSRTVDLFDKLGGAFIEERHVPKWSRHFVEELPEQVFAE
jgi:hypothetical protein